MTALLETAHLAGVTDGKVCFGVYRKADFSRYYPVLRVLSVRPTLPEFMKKQTKLGNVKSSPSKHTKDGLVYVWEVLDKEGIRKFITKVLPFLKIKKKQAELLYEFISLLDNKIIDKEKKLSQCGNFYWALRDLKKRPSERQLGK
jgi:hypothetical protein